MRTVNKEGVLPGKGVSVSSSAPVMPWSARCHNGVRSGILEVNPLAQLERALITIVWQACSRWQRSNSTSEEMQNSSAGAAGEEGTRLTTARKLTPEPPADEQGDAGETGAHSTPSRMYQTHAAEAAPACQPKPQWRRSRPPRRAGAPADSSRSPTVKSSPLPSDEKPRCDSGGELGQQRQQVEAALLEQEGACRRWKAQLTKEHRKLDKQWEQDHQTRSGCGSLWSKSGRSWSSCAASWPAGSRSATGRRARLRQQTRHY